MLCQGSLALATVWLPTWAATPEAGSATPASPVDKADPPAWSPVLIPATQKLDVRATGSGHRYRIFLSVPPGPVPPQGHPVLYVLDGNAAFPVAAFLSRGAARRTEVTGLSAPVVVGIGYPGDSDFHVPERRRDYTVGASQAGATATEGRADAFLDFIERDLKPRITAQYRIDPARQALFGHSFGGLLVLHALFTRPHSFSTYLASSPSIWWNDKQVLQGLPALQQRSAQPRPRVQVSVGALEDEPPKGKYTPEMLAWHAARPMVSEARSVATRLRGLPGWADRVVYHEFAGEEHGPVWLPALSRGMQYFLEQP
jgi:predicted alpha/beta superfamily hydrolase